MHLKIEKKRVVASEVSKAGGNPEAMEPRRSAQPTPSAPAKAPVSGLRPSTGPLTPMTANASPNRVPVPTFKPQPIVGDAVELGLGAMMQAAVQGKQAPPVTELELPEPEPALPESEAEPTPAAVEEEPAPEPESEIVIEERPATRPLIPEERETKVASNVPMSVQEIMQAPVNMSNPGTLQKMRDQGFYKNHHFKEAQCFDCDNKFKVGRSSRSANCPSCGAYISLEDVELNMPSTQAIKTRGDVLIRKRGHLTAPHLFARDLRCFGLVSANIHCAGDAIFKTSGTMIGEVRCRKFIVEKGSDIQFMNEVHADEIEISAPVKGDFFSKGKLSILATGAVDGSVTGRSINIEPGGELNGSMNIVRAAAV